MPPTPSTNDDGVLVLPNKLTAIGPGGITAEQSRSWAMLVKLAPCAMWVASLVKRMRPSVLVNYDSRQPASLL
jgi:hypothetical protein